MIGVRMEESMILATGIAIPVEKISEICRRFRVQELAMFGSAARGELRTESDVDLMVEFEPGYHPGLGWFDLEEQLEAALGRKVDAMQKKLLKPRVRIDAERDAIILYAA